MSTYESYLFNQHLPDNGLLRVAQDVMTLINVSVFSFTYMIAYMSPSSKESLYYKALIHAQGVSLFLFCILWSFFLKFIVHLDHGFCYTEGYCYLIGLTTAMGYTICSVLYGSYACWLISSYFFRLYLLVDYTHFFRIPYVLPSICVLIEIAYAVIAPMTFYMGYSEFDPTTVPFNLTQEQLDYLYSKSVMSYKLESFRETFYPIYFVALIALTVVVCLFAIFNIVRHIRIKQSLMSVGATKHHLRVLKILTIQVLCLAIVSAGAPAILALTLFVDINTYIVSVSLITMGSNSTVHSLLSLYLNPVFKRTVLNLSKFPSVRTSVFLVESTYK